jgi:hypothetical protein
MAIDPPSTPCCDTLTELASDVAGERRGRIAAHQLQGGLHLPIGDHGRSAMSQRCRERLAVSAEHRSPVRFITVASTTGSLRNAGVLADARRILRTRELTSVRRR